MRGDITGAQLRAARALVGMEQKALAEAAGISAPSLKRLEASPGHIQAYARTIEALKSTLERAGVEFLDDGEASAAGGPGVRLRERGAG